MLLHSSVRRVQDNSRHPGGGQKAYRIGPAAVRERIANFRKSLWRPHVLVFPFDFLSVITIPDPKLSLL
jgi:hypothetical protein